MGNTKIKLTDEELEKVLELRVRSKLGEKLSDEDTEFILSCFDKDPEGYRSLRDKVNELAKPFGAL